MKKDIILASESYLKNFIMKRSGLQYRQISAEIDERSFEDSDTKKLVEILSKEKCKKVASANENSVVIAADTIMTDSSNKQFHKPASKEDAITDILSLSGKTVNVHTGMTVYDKDLGYITKYTATQLEYMRFNKNHIMHLVKEDDPSMRSGAIGFFSDSPGFTLVKKFTGSYTGAMGLPMEELNPILYKLNIY